MAAPAPHAPPKKLGDCEKYSAGTPTCIHGWTSHHGKHACTCAQTHTHTGTNSHANTYANKFEHVHTHTQSAPESGTPDERLSVSFARREPVKGSDYVANCRALEREHGNGLSFTLRSALRTATRAKVRKSSAVACMLVQQH
eukprot:484197-Pelagomonas_calceolata.AAC.8